MGSQDVMERAEAPVDIGAADLATMMDWADAVMASRAPDFIIGPASDAQPVDYIRRWWIIPRNPWSNLYLHLTLRDDDDRALHDHPWSSRSVILSGGYVEITPEGEFKRRPGDVIERSAQATHRLVLHRDRDGQPIPNVSLFFTGPKERDWGFHCPQGFVPWQVFTGGKHGESVGRGCGE